MEGIPYHNQRVLILAPHADDETIGCGGVIQKYVRRNSQVRLLVASFLLGETKRYNHELGAYQPYQGDIREQEFKRAMGILGIDDCHFLIMDDAADQRYHTRLDAYPRVELAQRIENHIADFKPTVIYMPSVTKHQDHEALHLAALVATRPYFWNGTLFIYETDGELSFQPNLFIPLTRKEIGRKMDALQAYQTQIQESPHPVSAQALYDKAKYRGAQIYKEFAEAFQVARIHG